MSDSEENEKTWLAKLAKLNPATGKDQRSGKAPHKPLLLLSLLDAFEDGEMESRVFARTPSLVVRFMNYSAITAERWPTRMKIQMPFFYLRSQGLWESFTEGMQPAQSPESCMVNEMDQVFYDLCHDPGFRTKARMVLISTYFTDVEKIALFESVGLGSGSNAEKISSVVQEAAEAARQKGRSTRFRSRVVIEYRHTCALTGYRCDTSNGRSIVDAAHIDGWSETGNDELGNGLALSKNAHWMFDEGLWSVDPDWRIVVNEKRFEEQGPDALLLARLHGRHLQFDPSSRLRPDLDLLQKHRLRNLGAI